MDIARKDMSGAGIEMKSFEIKDREKLVSDIANLCFKLANNPSLAESPYAHGFIDGIVSFTSLHWSEVCAKCILANKQKCPMKWVWG